MRKHLFFSRQEFYDLPWYEQRMYAEELMDFLSEQAMQNWKASDPKKRGAPPINWREQRDRNEAIEHVEETKADPNKEVDWDSRKTNKDAELPDIMSLGFL